MTLSKHAERRLLSFFHAPVYSSTSMAEISETTTSVVPVGGRRDENFDQGLGLDFVFIQLALEVDAEVDAYAFLPVCERHEMREREKDEMWGINTQEAPPLDFDQRRREELAEKRGVLPAGHEPNTMLLPGGPAGGQRDSVHRREKRRGRTLGSTGRSTLGVTSGKTTAANVKMNYSPKEEAGHPARAGSREEEGEVHGCGRARAEGQEREGEGVDLVSCFL
ncbi:hypothetical protein K438DRAFT_1933038 [Mycena galopus ATCC 62051]|nr:hypothetical protein K438DRAFT_1933038 [Mycena galopus ATCC 62051]